MRRRLPILLAVFPAALVIAVLAEADARACMDWDGSLHVGYDDRARPFSTTWEAFLAILGTWNPRELGLMWGLSAAPFLFPALGALVVPARKVAGVWVAMGLSLLLWFLLLGNPSNLHDCDRKGADVLFLVVPFGLLAGLLCLAVGLLTHRPAKARR